MQKQNTKQIEVKQGDTLNFMYRVIYDAGKPYSEEYQNEQELKAGLKKFYVGNVGECAYMDSIVLNEQGEDISESQFITELISEILAECEGVSQEVLI
jgi:hypothetical protein